VCARREEPDKDDDSKSVALDVLSGLSRLSIGLPRSLLTALHRPPYVSTARDITAVAVNALRMSLVCVYCRRTIQCVSNRKFRLHSRQRSWHD
jgi:hypothetical protein